MSLVRIALLAAPLLLATGAAQAQETRLSPVDGNRLLGLCTSRDRTFVQGCEAYINGVADTAAVYQRAAGEPNSPVRLADTMCVPRNVTGAQMRDTVTNWLQGHAAERERPAGLIVFHVLHDAFPCR
jgi:hypothetical protein